MRTLFLISVVSLMLISVGIALAQTPPVLTTMEKMQKLMAGPQCTTSDKAVYGPDAVTQYQGMSFRCAYVYDEWLTRTNRVVWVRVKP
jgi:hypothetical protein